jgi:hypothetical protein
MFGIARLSMRLRHKLTTRLDAARRRRCDANILLLFSDRFARHTESFPTRHNNENLINSIAVLARKFKSPPRDDFMDVERELSYHRLLSAISLLISSVDSGKSTNLRHERGQ